MEISFVCKKGYIKYKYSSNANSQILYVKCKDATLDLPVNYSPESKTYIYIDLTEFKGEKVILETQGDFSFTECKKPKLSYFYKNLTGRSYSHFTPPCGHLNDPNGLFFDGERYHVYFQYYPYSSKGYEHNLWVRKSWGHLSTKDFINFTMHKNLLNYAKDGAKWSGCAVFDDNLQQIAQENNLLSFTKQSDACTLKNKSFVKNKNLVFFFYTLCGEQTQTVGQKPYLQKLAISCDGGYTIAKEQEVLDEFVPENRDPSVIFVKELNKWAMALYFNENKYGIFTSENLLNWQYIQTVEIEAERECPSLFCLNSEDGKDKYILSGANGKYLVGDWVDGKLHFSQPTKTVQHHFNYYASQNFYNSNVSIAWLGQAQQSNSLFLGALTFPIIKTLKTINVQYVLCHQPAFLENYIQSTLKLKQTFQFKNLKKRAYYFNAICSPKEGSVATISLIGNKVLVDTYGGFAIVNGRRVNFQPTSKIKIQIIADRYSAEVFFGEGDNCITVHNPSSPKKFFIDMSEGFINAELSPLKRIKVKEEK